MCPTVLEQGVSHARQAVRCSSSCDRFLVYEATVDGRSVRQITGTPNDPMEGWEGRQTVLIEDFDPCYLPGGRFAFISTRSQSFGRCHGGRDVPTNMLHSAEGVW